MPATKTTTTTTDGREQLLDAVRRSQAALVDGLRAWTETVQRFTPAPTAWPPADQLPSATEVVDSVFDAAAELLAAQRELAHGLLGATGPLAERARQAAAEAADRATKGA
jgi:hypothetical protein